MFLKTNDGLISGRFVVSIGKPEVWPHGIYHRVIYRSDGGSNAAETRAHGDDVNNFLRESEHVATR